MAKLVQVPIERLSAEAYTALLEEYASREGTDYGEREVPLADKVGQLKRQLSRGDISLVYDADSNQWDLLPARCLNSLQGGQRVKSNG